MFLLLLFFVLSIVFSFVCSILEAVLLSITPSFIRKQEEKNPKLFLNLNEFKEDIDRPLSAILTLNTIAHTVGAIGVGAQASSVFGSSEISFLKISISVESIIAAVMTLAILVLSEIIPKTIGANNWKSLAEISIKTLKFLIKILSPFVWLSQRITKGMKNEKNKSVLSRADLKAMTLAVSKEGTLNHPEAKVIQNVLSLPNKTIYDIMTPRTVLYSALESITLEEISKEERFKQFSRIPLFNEGREKIVGMVLKSEVLENIISGNPHLPLSDIKRPINTVKEDILLTNFFKKSYEKQAHIYAVEDSYGSITGLITLEDVLETILGYEIVDETDKVVDLQKHSLKNSGESTN